MTSPSPLPDEQLRMLHGAGVKVKLTKLGQSYLIGDGVYAPVMRGTAQEAITILFEDVGTYGGHPNHARLQEQKRYYNYMTYTPINWRR